MPSTEQNRIDLLSDWYRQAQLDIDKRMIGFRYEALKRYLQGPEGLELGPAEGQMTPFLLGHFNRLTVVDGSKALLELIPSAPNLVKIHSLFEAFEPERLFHTIILDHILEHIEQPVALLMRIKQWIAPAGRILIGVPNGHSFHRLLGVKMGLLKDPCELGERDYALGHRRVYTPDTFRKDLDSAELTVLEIGGVFFKALSNQQMQKYCSDEMIRGFYELGKDFPYNAAEIYAVCTAKK